MFLKKSKSIISVMAAVIELCYADVSDFIQVATNINRLRGSCQSNAVSSSELLHALLNHPPKFFVPSSLLLDDYDIGTFSLVLSM